MQYSKTMKEHHFKLYLMKKWKLINKKKENNFRLYFSGKNHNISNVDNLKREENNVSQIVQIFKENNKKEEKNETTFNLKIKNKIKFCILLKKPRKLLFYNTDNVINIQHVNGSAEVFVKEEDNKEKEIEYLGKSCCILVIHLNVIVKPK